MGLWMPSDNPLLRSMTNPVERRFVSLPKLLLPAMNAVGCDPFARHHDIGENGPL